MLKEGKEEGTRERKKEERREREVGEGKEGRRKGWRKGGGKEGGKKMLSGGNTINNTQRLVCTSPWVSSPSQVPTKGPGEQIQFSVVALGIGPLPPLHPEWKPTLYG